MKLNILFTVLMTTVLFNCTIEHGKDGIEDLVGKWQLKSVIIDGEQQITACDKTTISEFTSNGSIYSGNYTGTVYFWYDSLDVCDPETFNGTWEWDDDEVHLILNIRGVNSNISYSNSYEITYTFYDTENTDADVADAITLRFQNEDEDFERIYHYERIP